MAIFKCDSCGYEQDVPDKLSGKRAKCPECGQGVTIIDDALAEDLAAMFTEQEPDETMEDIPDGSDREPIDLDSGDVVVELSDKEDTLCDGCGLVVDGKDADTCPGCGQELNKAEEPVELKEGDLDVSDLTDDPPPQVWDTDFDERQSSSLEEGHHKKELSGFVGNLSQDVFAGLISGVMAFFFSLALSLLVSSRAGLHDFLPVLFTATLTGMGVGSLIFSLQSRIPFALAGPGTAMTGIIFFFLGSLYQGMAGTFVPETILATLLAAVVVTSFVAGLGLWIIGALRAGNLIRYVPLQIIGGVIGGLGVYVIIGALDWIGQLELDWGHLFTSLRESVLYLQPTHSLSVMGPSLIFGLILFIGLGKYKNSLFLLGMLLVASAAGYCASIWGTDSNVVSLSLPVQELKSGVPLFSLGMFREGIGDVQWDIIRANGLYIGALGCLIALTGAYRISRLELLLGREVDLSGELRALGITNCFSGLCGGMPVGVSFGRSAGNFASGARGALSGVVAGVVIMTGMWNADILVGYIPRFVPEGLLLFAGLALVRGWLFKARTSFTRKDDLWMLWVTFLATVVFGMLIGIGFGVALALMVTVRRNSMGGPVLGVLSGSVHRSNVDRASAQHRVLKEYGDHIHIVRLRGFLFLGSMETLLSGLRERLSDNTLLPVEYIILDFHKVTGLASATGIGFRKLYDLIEEYDVALVIASAPLELEEHLEKSGLFDDGGGGFRVFFDLDYAMEWCENRVLESENLLEIKEMSLAALLEPVFPEPRHIPALMKVLKRVVVKKGDTVFRQGDESDSMYFVESGRLDVELETEDGKVIRLKKVGPGAVFGEMGIYTLSPRSATVRATEKSVVYLMTTAKLEAVEKRAPQLVTSINRFMINLLADRLKEANFKVRELMR